MVFTGWRCKFLMTIRVVHSNAVTNGSADNGWPAKSGLGFLNLVNSLPTLAQSLGRLRHGATGRQTPGTCPSNRFFAPSVDLSSWKVKTSANFPWEICFSGRRAGSPRKYWYLIYSTGCDTNISWLHTY